RQAERVSDHFRDVFRLHQQIGLVGAAFLFEKFGDARRRSAAWVNAKDADAVGVHFFAQTVGDGAKGVLRGGKLSSGGGRTESGGRIDENDLPFAFAKQKQHGLNHEVMAADVRTVHQIEIGERSFLEKSVGNCATAEHQNIHASKIFLTTLA